jgi:hypothetical protein
LSPVNCIQRTPEGFPSGIPGIGDVIEGAMQHAPQPCLQFIHMTSLLLFFLSAPG